MRICGDSMRWRPSWAVGTASAQTVERLMIRGSVCSTLLSWEGLGQALEHHSDTVKAQRHGEECNC